MAVSHPLDLSTLVQRLGGLPPFNIGMVTPDDRVQPWYDVDLGDVCQQLVVRDTDLARDVGAIAVQIVHWGRLEAQARRVWQAVERHYRVWRSRMVLSVTQPPANAPTAWKKPTESQVDAICRAAPDYAALNQASEAAEEAFNASRMIREAFLAKRDMIRVAVRAAPDHSGPRLAV